MCIVNGLAVLRTRFGMESRSRARRSEPQKSTTDDKTTSDDQRGAAPEARKPPVRKSLGFTQYHICVMAPRAFTRPVECSAIRHVRAASVCCGIGPQ